MKSMENEYNININNKVIAELLLQILSQQLAINKILISKLSNSENEEDEITCLLNSYSNEELNRLLESLFERHGNIGTLLKKP